MLLDVSSQEEVILDDFEGDEYVKQDVTVEGELQRTEASAYVYRDRLGLSAVEWTYEAFRREGLPDFLAMCEGYVREERQAKGIGTQFERL